MTALHRHLFFCSLVFMFISQLTINTASASGRCPDDLLPDANLIAMLVSYPNKSSLSSASSSGTSFSSSNNNFLLDSAAAAGVELVESVPAFVRSAPSIVLRASGATPSAATLELSTRSRLRFLNLSLYNISYDGAPQRSDSSSSSQAAASGQVACESSTSGSGSGSGSPVVRLLAHPKVTALPSQVVLSPVAAGRSHLVCAVADFMPDDESGYEVRVRRTINCTRFDVPPAPLPAASALSGGVVILYILLALLVLFGLILLAAAIGLRQQCARERLKDVKLPATLQDRCSCVFMWLGLYSPAASAEESAPRRRASNTNNEESSRRGRAQEEAQPKPEQLSRKAEAQHENIQLQTNAAGKSLQNVKVSNGPPHDQYVQLLIHSEVTDFASHGNHRFSTVTVKSAAAKTGNKKYSCAVAATSPQKSSRRHHSRRATAADAVEVAERLPHGASRDQSHALENAVDGAMSTTQQPVSPQIGDTIHPETQNTNDKRYSGSPHSLGDANPLPSRVSPDNSPRLSSGTQSHATPNTQSSQIRAMSPQASNRNQSQGLREQSPLSNARDSIDERHNAAAVKCAVNTVVASTGLTSTAVLSRDRSGVKDEWTLNTAVLEAADVPSAAPAATTDDRAISGPENSSQQVAVEVEEQPFSVCLVLPQLPDTGPILVPKLSSMQNPESNFEAERATDVSKQQPDDHVNESVSSSMSPNSGSGTASGVQRYTTASTNALRSPIMRAHPHERRHERNRDRKSDLDPDGPRTNSNSGSRPRQHNHQQQRRHTDASVDMVTARISNAATQTGRGRLSTGLASGSGTTSTSELVPPNTRHLMAHASGTSLVAQRHPQPRLGLTSGQMSRQSLTTVPTYGGYNQTAHTQGAGLSGNREQHYSRLSNGDLDNVWVMRTSHL